MSKVEFFVDQVKERDFGIEAIELLAAPFEHAGIYCLNYFSGLLGPIAKRKIRSSGQFLHFEHCFQKLPLLSGSLKLPSANNSLVALSRGMLPLTKNCRLYYFYAPFWESEEYKIFHQSQNWFVKKWLDFYCKKIILSLQKNQHKVMVASKQLALRYELTSSEILYPFFKSEDFPYVELATEKNAVTIYLKGSSGEQKTELANHLAKSSRDWYFYIFGEEKDRLLFNEIHNVRFESEFCAATLQAAFLQSRFFFQFPHGEELSMALGALACGSYVAHGNSDLLMEIIPQGLLLLCHDIQDIFHMTYQWSDSQVLLNISEARRFALRFSERNFKDKFLAKLNSKQYK